MASGTTNGKTSQTSENIFLPKISSDNNANPNNMKHTGAIPKTKNNSSTSNLSNGINSEVRAKFNNNHEISNCKPERNGSCSQLTDSYIQNNVDIQHQDKQCIKNSAKLHKSCTTGTNGFKSSSIVNGVHNGSLCNQLNVHNQEQRLLNTLSRSNHEEVHLQAAIPNGIDPGPSTSRDVINIPHFALQQRLRDSESECSSDTGNDDLSCSDECCIYTYKGDMADLPSSFLNLDIQDNNDTQDQSRAGSRGSSPEMDFLEMDFDPGPSCDADSDESSINSDIKSEDNLLEGEREPYRPEDAESSEPLDQSDVPVNVESVESSTPQTCEKNEENNLSLQNSVNTNTQPELQNLVLQDKSEAKDEQLKINLTDEPWIPKIAAHRTFCSSNLRESKGHHNSSGDLISPIENILPSTNSLDCRLNTWSSLYHSTMEKQLVLDKQHTSSEECVLTVEKTMIWSEQEAAQKQITQIGTSACGATAILNVLLALGHPVPTNEKLMECVTTRLRANFSPLVTYLKSRSIAGTTHKDIIKGLHTLTNGQIYARFFHMHPERYINLSQWLSYWIKKGAVPIATLNLQKGVKAGNSIPDAWHHQMLFGVGPHGIYMTNPLEKVEEGILWHQLSSESVLLVRREDIISRWNDKTNLRELMSMRDVRWHKLNVLGQVANVIREHHRLVSPHAVSRTHVTIPAAYSAGITLAINVNNSACELLKHCPELPILNTLP